MRPGENGKVEDAPEKSELMKEIEALQDRVAAMGQNDPDFDMKAFTDEMWGDS